jgi:hypothetical protein
LAIDFFPQGGKFLSLNNPAAKEFIHQPWQSWPWSIRSGWLQKLPRQDAKNATSGLRHGRKERQG